MASFVVFKNRGGDLDLRGNSTWKVLDNGVLHVWDEPNQRTWVFGPSGWERVEYDSPEPPRSDV